MKREKGLLICIILAATFVFMGCSSEEKKLGLIEGTKLIHEESVSPNKEYVTPEKDSVNYSVKVYQNGENTIIVDSDSNSAFFEKIQYEVEYGKEISESDVEIKWTTLMGNPEPTEEDTLAIANVSISANGEIFSQRKINFINRGIEIIVDTIEKKKE